MKTLGRPAPRRASTGRVHSPTREALLRLLESQHSPSSIAALARATGWHENTVRGHLRALWEDGYVTRTRDDRRGGQGRPSWLWSAADREPSTPYAALSSVLAETLARVSPEPVRDAREAGRAWGRAIGAELPAAASRDEARRAVVDTMRDQGFAPVETGGASRAGAEPGADPGAAAIVLRQCPLIEAAAKHTRVVCAVHLGMIAGVLETIGAADGGSELIPFSSPGECTLRLRVAE